MAVGRRGNLLSDSRTNDVARAAVEQLCNNFRPNYLTLRKLFKLFSKQLQLPWSHFACCRARHDKLARPATEANQSGELMVLWGCAVLDASLKRANFSVLPRLTLLTVALGERWGSTAKVVSLQCVPHRVQGKNVQKSIELAGSELVVFVWILIGHWILRRQSFNKDFFLTRLMAISLFGLQNCS